MSEQKKKIIPKLKKNLQGFLADESGKLTKQDVLKLAIGAMAISTAFGQAQADTFTNGPGYMSWSVADGQCSVNLDISSSMSPSSVLVNGHANNLSSIATVIATAHGSHGSHAQW